MFGHEQRAVQRPTSASTASRAVGIRMWMQLAVLPIRRPIRAALPQLVTSLNVTLAKRMPIIRCLIRRTVGECTHLISVLYLLNVMAIWPNNRLHKKKLAFCRAVALGLEPSSEVRRWYGVISCCIQRANAKILRGEPVPGRPSAQPPRLLARGRDLALVGA